MKKIDKMKLTIEHLAPYLPYFLKCQDEDGKIGIFSGYDFNGMPIDFSNYTISYNWDVKPNSTTSDWLVFNDGEHITRIKPILRPLSDLTKMIEHNGEKFVPLPHIYGDDFTPNDQYFENLHELCIGYREMLLLFEWHFDVFGLIDKGLAINLNEL